MCGTTSRPWPRRFPNWNAIYGRPSSRSCRRRRAIDLTGLNTFTGTLWLAALRAASEMAGLLGEPDIYTETFAAASPAYDEALFTGEYYAQRLLPGDSTDFQWVDGCLADQLIGQWWA